MAALEAEAIELRVMQSPGATYARRPVFIETLNAIASAACAALSYCGYLTSIGP